MRLRRVVRGEVHRQPDVGGSMTCQVCEGQMKWQMEAQKNYQPMNYGSQLMNMFAQPKPKHTTFTPNLMWVNGRWGYADKQATLDKRDWRRWSVGAITLMRGKLK